MASGGVTAEFDFVSYKIDIIDLRMGNKVQNILDTRSIRLEDTGFSISLRNTLKFRADDGRIVYVGGITIKVSITDKDGGDNALDAIFGIAGAFTPAGDVSSEDVDSFAKVNIPAILMPHLRATMTTVLSNAGFGTVLFPLVNIYELAKKSDLPIIEHTMQDDGQTPEAK
jgi:preprotein translocase subunit SecB